TTLYQDINPGPGSSFPDFLTNINGTLYFGADDGVHGHELWKVMSGGEGGRASGQGLGESRQGLSGAPGGALDTPLSVAGFLLAPAGSWSASSSLPSSPVATAVPTSTGFELPPLDSTGLDALLASLGEGKMASAFPGAHRASRSQLDDAMLDWELRALLD